MPKSTVSKLALLIAVAGGTASASLPSPAAAAGFTGSFAPGNWTLNTYLNDPGYPVGTNITPTGSVTYTDTPNYECVDPGADVNCIADLNSSAGTATLIGSNNPPNSNPDESWVTQWELSPYAGPSPYTVNFSWNYFTLDGQSDDQPYYYTINPSDPTNPVLYPLSSTSGDVGTESVVLLTGWRLGFGIHTVQNTGGPGYLTITQFDAAAVPGPLPLFGAAAAFGWSRRLRRRQSQISELIRP